MIKEGDKFLINAEVVNVNQSVFPVRIKIDSVLGDYLWLKDDDISSLIDGGKLFIVNIDNGNGYVSVLAKDKNEAEKKAKKWCESMGVFPVSISFLRLDNDSVL